MTCSRAEGCVCRTDLGLYCSHWHEPFPEGEPPNFTLGAMTVNGQPMDVLATAVAAWVRTAKGAMVNGLGVVLQFPNGRCVDIVDHDLVASLAPAAPAAGPSTPSLADRLTDAATNDPLCGQRVRGLLREAAAALRTT